MGDYITIADLEERFNSTSEVAFLTGQEATGVPDADREAEHILAGEGDINSRIGKMVVTGSRLVSTASASALAVVKAYSLDCAEYRMRIGLGAQASDDKTRMYERALEWAAAVGRGEFVLDGAETIDSSLARQPGAWWSTSDREHETDAARNISRNTGIGCL